MRPITSNNLMSSEEIDALLTGQLSGVLSMNGPYAVPMHHIWLDGCIYFHGAKTGGKIDAINACPDVCYTVFEEKNYVVNQPKNACNISTAYESVVINGKCQEVTELEDKKKILYKMLEAMYPELTKLDMPDEMLNATAVFCIKPKSIIGKARFKG